MPTILLRNVIAGELPIFFEQQLDPVADQMAVFPAQDREAFMAICHAKRIVRSQPTSNHSGSSVSKRR